MPNSDRKRPCFKMSDFFDERLAFWEIELKKELVAKVGVPADVVEQLKVYPTTPLPKDRLPNTNQWYVPLWLHIVEILPPAATVRFVGIHRGNICDEQTPFLRKRPKTAVNLSRGQMSQFVGAIGAAIEAAGIGRIEQPPPTSEHAQMEVSLPIEDNLLAVTSEASKTVTKEDVYAHLMSVSKSAEDSHTPPEQACQSASVDRQRQTVICCYCVCRGTATDEQQ